MTPSDSSSAARLIIAIDGPSGAGKGTVSRSLAVRLKYRHIDTGAMYRAVAWKAVQEGLDLRDEDAIAELAARVRIDVSDGTIAVDGHDDLIFFLLKHKPGEFEELGIVLDQEKPGVHPHISSSGGPTPA